MSQTRYSQFSVVFLPFLLAWGVSPSVWGDGSSRVTLKNGMVFEGELGETRAIAENPLVQSTSAGRLIVIVDDQLRRTYFPFQNMALSPEPTGRDERPIEIQQRVATNSPIVGSVGAIFNVTPFDAFGHRSISIATAKGPRTVLQGITEIGPTYARVQSMSGEHSVTWDMRMATSSIPPETLREILLKNRKNQGADARRDMVRLLFQSEQYQRAAKELELAMEQFPELAELRSLHQQLLQSAAQQLLDEIKRRRDAGQHDYVQRLLQNFPRQDVATQILVEAADMLKEYQDVADRRTRTLEAIKELVASVAGEPHHRKLIEALYEEIQQDLGVNNIGRMSDFNRFAGSKELGKEEQLAIALSGWLLGQGEVIQNLAVASSLLEVRELVLDYLRSMGEEKREARREILARIRQLEGGTPAFVAKLISQLKPPHPLPESTSIRDYYQVQVPGMPKEFPVSYDVQLPMEYEPYHRYPVVVSLHAGGTRPEAQIQWWAGDYDEGMKLRQGLANRHGYIVIAPSWSRPGQLRYEYTAAEHNIVLASLRDAMRRFSIDSDRVVLSGHGMGGDAAWDIGVSHPDLWAGMAIVGGMSDYGGVSDPKYVLQYTENGKQLPMYFVYGELDGNKMADNATALNRYMRSSGFDPIVVQYRGRGNEHFYEEIHRLYQWMTPLRRKFAPEEFEVNLMRPWDNFFWYAEVTGLPSASLVSPASWPSKQFRRPSILKGSVKNNRVSLTTGAEFATVWLSPEMVDFSKEIEISINKPRNEEVAPDLEVILEDARTRADRQHLFWSKIELRTGRR